MDSTVWAMYQGILLVLIVLWGWTVMLLYHTWRERWITRREWWLYGAVAAVGIVSNGFSFLVPTPYSPVWMASRLLNMIIGIALVVVLIRFIRSR